MELFNSRLLSRSMHSKIKIFQALETLMSYEDFDRIAVKHICEVAHIGKTTFYSHFKDKYDIIQWFTTLYFDIGIARIGRTLTWEQGHRISTSGFLHHRPLLSKAFQSMDYNGLAMYSPRRRENNLVQTLSEYKKVEITPRLHAQIIALSVGEAAYFHRYLVENNSPKLDELVDALMGIIPPQLYKLLKEPAVSKKDNITEEMMNVEFITLMLSSEVE
jgi:AcrR family transcriptional regulator